LPDSNLTTRWDETFADDLDVRPGRVSSRVALLLRAAERKPASPSFVTQHPHQIRSPLDELRRAPGGGVSALDRAGGQGRPVGLRVCGRAAASCVCRGGPGGCVAKASVPDLHGRRLAFARGWQGLAPGADVGRRVVSKRRNPGLLAAALDPPGLCARPPSPASKDGDGDMDLPWTQRCARDGPRGDTWQTPCWEASRRGDGVTPSERTALGRWRWVDGVGSMALGRWRWVDGVGLTASFGEGGCLLVSSAVEVGMPPPHRPRFLALGFSP
jgi:hypothetical protein